MNLLKNEWRYGDQDQIKVEAIADLKAGDVLVVGANVIGIVLLDTATGQLANVATSGVWEMLKGTGTITPGVAVYWDATNKVVTATAGTDPYIGVAIPPTDAAYANTCYVQLRQNTIAIATT